MNPLHRQGLRFLAVGGCATVTDAVLFILLVQAGADPRIANMLSYPLSAVLAFWLHRHWTFSAGEGAVGGQAVRFAATVGLGLALSTMIVWLLSPFFEPFAAKAVAIGATVVLNFTVSRGLVFHPSRTENEGLGRRAA